jgi:hypothetical protein
VIPALPTSGTLGEFVSGEPIGLGFRVPTIVWSPWRRGGWVCSDTFDHTLMLRFLERRFRVREPRISTWRRRTCGDLTSPLALRPSRYERPVAAGDRAADGGIEHRLQPVLARPAAARDPAVAGPGAGVAAAAGLER